MQNIYARLLSAGAFRTNAQTSFVELDATAAALYGFEAAPWRDVHAALLTHVLPEDVPLVNGSGMSQRQRPDGALESTSRPFRVRMPGGQLAWRRWKSLSRRGDPHIEGIILDQDDLLAQEAQARQWRQSALRSEQLSVAGRVAGPLAHDLANLLSIVIPSLDFLREALESPDDLQLLEGAQLASQAVSGLTRQFVRLVQNDGLMQPVDLRRELILSERLLRLSMPHGLTLTVAPPATSLTVMASAGLVINTLAALLDNARHALQGSGEVQVRAWSEGEAGYLEVRDNGPGFPPELLADPGQPFVTSKGDQGTGLGLFNVRRAVEGCGGQLLVHSRPGDTRVQIWLPLLAHALPEPELPLGGWGAQRDVVYMIQDDALARLVERALQMVRFRPHRVPSPGAISHASLRFIPYRFIIDLDSIAPRDLSALQDALQGALFLGHQPPWPAAQLLPKPFMIRELLAALL
jgi:signal transduction histidine kinase